MSLLDLEPHERGQAYSWLFLPVAIPGVKMADSSATRRPTSAGRAQEGEELIPMRSSEDSARWIARIDRSPGAT